MFRLAIIIWIGLIGYRLYDWNAYRKLQESASRKAPPTRNEATPQFDPQWEGHSFEKIRAKRIDTQMGDVVPAGQKKR